MALKLTLAKPVCRSAHQAPHVPSGGPSRCSTHHSSIFLPTAHSCRWSGRVGWRVQSLSRPSNPESLRTIQEPNHPNRHPTPPAHDSFDHILLPMTVQAAAAHQHCTGLCVVVPGLTADTMVSVRCRADQSRAAVSALGSKLAGMNLTENQTGVLKGNAPQAPPSLDIAFDEPLDTPFLRPAGAISRPGSFSFGHSGPSTASKTPSPIRISNSFSCSINRPPFTTCADPADPNIASSTGSSRRSFDVPLTSPAATPGEPIKRVSWLDCGFGPSTGVNASFGSMQSLVPAGQTPAQDDIWSTGSLLSVKSAPVASARPAGDLRDQGRISCSGGRISGTCEAHEAEPYTPLQAISPACINNLLGSLGTSLFSDTPSATPSAAAAAGSAGRAAKAAPVLPDFVEAWGGGASTAEFTDTAAATAMCAASADIAANSHNGGRRSSSTSSSGSVFATASAFASAAVAATVGAMDSQSSLLPSYGSFSGGVNQALPYAQPLMHAYSTPAQRVSPYGSFSGVSTAFVAATNSMHAEQQQAVSAAAAAADGFSQETVRAPAYLQRTGSAGGVMPAASFAASLAPTYSNAYPPSSFSVASAGQFYGYPSAAMPLQGMSSVPVGPGAYSNPAAVAAMMQMQAHQQSSIAAAAAAATGAPAGVYEAWALAYFNSTMSSSRSLERQGSSFDSSSNGSWSSQAGGLLPPSESCPVNWRQGLETVGSFREGQSKQVRKFGSAANSKVDPKSMCGVDPRLCVGSPGDVEAEVCRRNPGLAELLRMAPRSVKLNNVPVRQDMSPPELLASKRVDGPITPDELTIESGLLRHCFGLPSSIGPDLVRAARHAVAREDGTPGSGLEPFFWVLQAKLNWLLKRPVFFKGQLLRGEIHAITDLQRAQSFSQVTEQRSKLGELLLVLYSMLQADSSAGSA